MTAEQLGLLQHSLGVDQHGRGRMYRNFFCAGGSDEQVCRELIDLGYMKQHRTTEMLPYFNCSVTEAGKVAMLAESPKPPKLTPGQQRYRKWLDVADCYPDMTFGDWLKMQRQGAVRIDIPQDSPQSNLIEFKTGPRKGTLEPVRADSGKPCTCALCAPIKPEPANSTGPKVVCAGCQRSDGTVKLRRLGTFFCDSCCEQISLAEFIR